MKILVIGAGVIGVTTAYALTCRGHQVTVIDRHDGVAQETSFANGSLLTPSMSEPWNSPGSWRVLLSSLGRTDTALQLRARALCGLGGWGVRFLRNSKQDRFERNTHSNLRLALYSRAVMQGLRERTGIGYSHSAPGSLRMFRDPDLLDRATVLAQRLRPQGLESRRLSVAATVELEPALEPLAGQLAGALYYAADEIGDAHLFCVALAEHARLRGADFVFQAQVTSLEHTSGRTTGVQSTQGRFVADHYVVAAGSYSTPLLKLLRINLPVQPAKGYSVTLDHRAKPAAPRVPIVDDQWHAAMVPLGNSLRVVGTAEFAGYDLTIPPSRIRNLLKFVDATLPGWRFEPRDVQPWTGLRPMSADGVPIIGPTSIRNLSVSSGHGHLGWTMAAGSAELLADLITGATTALDHSPYSLARFAAGR